MKTFVNQSKLPRLPIPSLEDTTSKYLKSLKPLLSVKQFANSEKIAASFLQNEGPKLQKLLKQHDSQSENNWLEDIWLEKAYLQWRCSVVNNSNWWVQFKDFPQQNQISRAASIISGLLEVKKSIDNESLSPDTQGKAKIPLCMDQYRHQFGVTRIPGREKDSIHHSDTSVKHIIVLSNNHIYKMNVFGPNFETPSLSNIEKALSEILKSSMKKECKTPVAILTSEDRNVWAEAREHLISLKNESNLKIIEDALFSVSLDPVEAEDVETSHKLLYGGLNGHNRWFDKSLSFVVLKNGRAGCNGEHSPSDAITSARIIRDILMKSEINNNSIHTTSSPTLVESQLLEWKVDEKILSFIKNAEVRVVKDNSDIDSVLLHFNSFGSEKIKDLKVSPDAFIQMAIQMAYFRIYEAPCSTYESASTRQFLHGRTETIRTCSEESVAFTNCFDNDSVTKENKRNTFLRAIEAHNAYSLAASNGNGIDRHLLGLRVMGDSALFTDPAFAHSCGWVLSTSNVSPGDYLYGGFGPVNVDGYGINYAIGKDNLKFSISCRRNGKNTDSMSFRKILGECLKELIMLNK